MPIDSTAIALDVTAGPISAYLDPDEILAYALAVEDDHPRYRDGSAVPPTYSVTPALPLILGFPEFPASVVSGSRAIVHGEQDMVLHRPLIPGSEVGVTAARRAVIPTGAGLLVDQVVRVVDGSETLLAEHHWVTMIIGEASGPTLGDPPPDHRFPEEARGRPVGTVSIATTRDQTFRYAGASGDRNPMHVNDRNARARGFPRKFNQGLCTLGITAGGLVRLAGGGDPTQVSRLACRFAAPAFPGESIDVDVYDIGPLDDGGHAFAFEARSGGRAVLRHGRFETRG